MNIKVFTSSFLGLILVLSLWCCDSKDNARSRQARLEMDRHMAEMALRSIEKNERLNQLKRMPNAPTKTPTRFAIYRMNDRTGSDDLLKNPYVLDKKHGVTFYGFAVDDLAKEAADSVFLILNNKDVFPTNYGGNSDGFANESKNPKYNRAAFRINIPFKRLEEGENEIKVIIVGHGSQYKYAPLRTYKVIKDLQNR